MLVAILAAVESGGHTESPRTDRRLEREMAVDVSDADLVQEAMACHKIGTAK